MNPVTEALAAVRANDAAAFDALLDVVYEELRTQAHRQLRHERSDHTLNTTALVHETYLKLVGQMHMNWQNRAHFFAAASVAMRRILTDYARSKQRDKRRGLHVTLSHAEGIAPAQGPSPDYLLSLDAALDRLGRLNPRYVRVVECRYFVGLTIKETAEALAVAPSTVSEDWRFARAWLRRALADTPEG
ncbi:MAG: ECF-type sigma factor [Bacteroidota bacterium]